VGSKGASNQYPLGTTTYAAFGQAEQATGLRSRYGYTSRELDPTGLMYYRARYYQPEVGRLASADPILPEPPHTALLNKFSYAKNRPTSLTDPTGLRYDYTPGEVLGISLGVVFALGVGALAFAIALGCFQGKFGSLDQTLCIVDAVAGIFGVSPAVAAFKDVSSVFIALAIIAIAFISGQIDATLFFFLFLYELIFLTTVIFIGRRLEKLVAGFSPVSRGFIVGAFVGAIIISDTLAKKGIKALVPRVDE